MLVALFRVYLDSVLLNFPIFKGVAPISFLCSNSQYFNYYVTSVPDALQIQDLDFNSLFFSCSQNVGNNLAVVNFRR